MLKVAAGPRALEAQPPHHLGGIQRCAVLYPARREPQGFDVRGAGEISSRFEHLVCCSIWF